MHKCIYIYIHMCQKGPSFVLVYFLGKRALQKEAHYLHSKTKEPIISQKELDISTKEPYISAKVPYISTKKTSSSTLTIPPNKLSSFSVK
mmetsp:Transcript_25064/g.36831  ORF Transcript_25064/g.36831 Transcript_25064/m.36831 type:complete len:90 (-) Transcript_25064:321-590(-)